MLIVKQHCVTMMGCILAVWDSGWGNGSLATISGEVSHVTLTIAWVEGT